MSAPTQEPKLRWFSDGLFPEFRPPAILNPPPYMTHPLDYTDHLRRFQHPNPSSHPAPGALPYPWLYQPELLSFETYPAKDQWRVRLQKKNGERYDGTWEQGQAHGDGTFIYENGNRYEGQFSRGKPHGKGKATNANGDVYDGQWDQSLRHGHGIEIFASGGGYDGEWVGNVRCGQGKMVHADGSTYVGEFQNDKRDGQGVYTTPQGETFSGEWKCDQEDGHVVHTLTDGSSWAGPWTAGQRDGQGVATLPDGTQYHSVWRGGEERTCGVYTNTKWKSPLRMVMGASIVERGGRSFDGRTRTPAKPNIRRDAYESGKHRSHHVWHDSVNSAIAPRWSGQPEKQAARYGSRFQPHDLLDYVPASESLDTSVPRLAPNTFEVQHRCDVYGTKCWG